MRRSLGGSLGAPWAHGSTARGPVVSCLFAADLSGCVTAANAVGGNNEQPFRSPTDRRMAGREIRDALSRLNDRVDPACQEQLAEYRASEVHHASAKPARAAPAAGVVSELVSVELAESWLPSESCPTPRSAFELFRMTQDEFACEVEPPDPPRPQTGNVWALESTPSLEPSLSRSCFMKTANPAPFLVTGSRFLEANLRINCGEGMAARITYRQCAGFVSCIVGNALFLLYRLSGMSLRRAAHKRQTSYVVDERQDFCRIS